MKPQKSISLAAVAVFCAGLAGCHANQRQDTVLSWALNPSHSWRATILLREYFIDGHVDDAATTYVLLDRTGDDPDDPPRYESGQDFKDAQVVMKPKRCGSLRVNWTGEQTLEVICEQCGLSLAAAGRHPTGMGAIRIDYVGFPERSSWEPGR